jgi:hypothetical protein
MIKTVNRLLAATAALGLVAAPIVAQANTRAGDSGFSYSAPGLGRSADGEGQEEAGVGAAEVGLGIAAGALIVGGIVIASDNDNDRASPGT